MSERRLDPTTGEWITFATHRQNRVFLPPPDHCPLCPTREGSATLTEIPRPDFDLVVFDNQFPAMQPMPLPAGDGGRAGARDGASDGGSDLLPVRSAHGRCEVIVYSPEHETTLAQAGYRTVRTLVDVWADRYAVLGEEGHAYVLPFENKGEQIGVTLHHPHGQVYAFPDVPPRPLRELTAAARHRSSTGRCVDCDVVGEELERQDRIVVRGRSWIAHVPFWARFPYELRIVPTEHRSCLLDLGADERDDLAEVLVAVLRGLDELFGFSMPYVMGLFGRPTGSSPDAAGWVGDWDDISHLHLMVSPPHRSAEKLKYLAGSELMGGAFMTDVAPERAAASLREAVTRAG